MPTMVMKHPLDLVAYLRGEQSFYRASLLVGIGIVVVFATYSNILMSIFDDLNLEQLELLSRWVIVFRICSIVGLWILGRCSTNIAAAPARYSAFTFVLVLSCAWGISAGSLISLMGASYGT